MLLECRTSRSTSKESDLEQKRTTYTCYYLHCHHFDSVRGLAGETVKNYLEAGTVQGRAEFVLNPERILPLMKAYYKEVQDLKIVDYKKVTSEKVNHDGEWYDVSVVRMIKDESGESEGAPSHYYVEKSKDGFKIDWEASTGQGDLGWVEFIASRPSEPKTMRAQARLLSGVCTGLGNLSSSYYSVALDGPHDERTVFACAEKGSQAGAKIYEALKSGDTRNVTVSMYYPSRIEFPVIPNDKVIVKSFVSDSWMGL